MGGNGPGAPPTGGQTGTLNGNPMADSTVLFLYPYDKTVWPQGLLAPLLQWDPGAHTLRQRVRSHQRDELRVQRVLRGERDAVRERPHPAAGVDDDGVLERRRAGERHARYSARARPATAAPARLMGLTPRRGRSPPPPSRGPSITTPTARALVKNSDTTSSTPITSNTARGRWPSLPAPRRRRSSPASTASTPDGDGDGVPRLPHGVRQRELAGHPGLQLERQRLFPDRLHQPRQRHDRRRRHPAGDAEPRVPRAVQGRQPALLELRRHDQRRHLEPALRAARGTLVPGVTGLAERTFRPRCPRFRPTASTCLSTSWRVVHRRRRPPLPPTSSRSAFSTSTERTAFSNPRVLYTPTGGTPVTYSSFLPTSAGIVFEVELGEPLGRLGLHLAENTASCGGSTSQAARPHIASTSSTATTPRACLPPGHAGGQPHAHGRSKTRP